MVVGLVKDGKISVRETGTKTLPTREWLEDYDMVYNLDMSVLLGGRKVPSIRSMTLSEKETFKAYK